MKLDKKVWGSESFKEFLKFLHSNKVKYLLIGGWAVGIHANPGLTADIDFLVGRDDKNIEKVISALAEFGVKGVEKSFFKLENNTFEQLADSWSLYSNFANVELKIAIYDPFNGSETYFHPFCVPARFKTFHFAFFL